MLAQLHIMRYIMLCKLWLEYSLPFLPDRWTKATKLAKTVHAHALSHPHSGVRLWCAIHAVLCLLATRPQNVVTGIFVPLTSSTLVSKSDASPMQPRGGGGRGADSPFLMENQLRDCLSTDDEVPLLAFTVDLVTRESARELPQSYEDL